MSKTTPSPTVPLANIFAEQLLGRHLRPERIVVGNERNSGPRRRRRYNYLPVPLGCADSASFERYRHRRAINVRQPKNVVHSVIDNHILPELGCLGTCQILHHKPVSGVDNLPLRCNIYVKKGRPLPGPVDSIGIRGKVATG
uniref:(northern house mosquito) hypothetical protein n=1 Tax=Culex pipiens TaxID=7175 RepID=A0A8D8JGT0_CULPI